MYLSEELVLQITFGCYVRRILVVKLEIFIVKTSVYSVFNHNFRYMGKLAEVVER